MKKRTSVEYTELKKNIEGYINKYPNPDKKWNKEKLLRLEYLRNKLDNYENRQEYYKIRDEIVLSNGGFAMKYAIRYHSVVSEDISIAELFQEATIGLIETIDAFTTSKKTSFTTYAFFHIRKRIIDLIKKNKLVKAPRDIARNLKHVNEAQGNLLSIKKREPTIQEISKYLKDKKNIKLKEEIIDRILIQLELNSSKSNESFISEYNDHIVCEEEDTSLFRRLELNILNDIKNYSEIDKRAIVLRYGIGEDSSHILEEVRILLDLPDNYNIK